MDIKRIVTPNYGTNCYLLSGEGFAAVIDPGEEIPELLAFLNEHSSVTEKLILLTHCHFDHIEGVNVAKELWNCPIVISESDAEGLFDNRINLSGYWSERVVSLNADKTVADGDEIVLGSETIKVIATPGHTKGSICYLWKNVLFSGDTLFTLSVGRSDLPTASPRELLASLHKLSKLDGEITVLPGHGQQTTIDYERRFNRHLK